MRVDVQAQSEAGCSTEHDVQELWKGSPHKMRLGGAVLIVYGEGAARHGSFD
jgi:hypothetical protein